MAEYSSENHIYVFLNVLIQIDLIYLESSIFLKKIRYDLSMFFFSFEYQHQLIKW